MHPLERQRLKEQAEGTFIDNKLGYVKRRSSLDNSSLTATGTLKQMLSDACEDDDDYDSKPKRRLSWDNKIKIIPTFLAQLQPMKIKGLDLDLDWHSSSHHPSKLASGLGGGLVGNPVAGGSNSTGNARQRSMLGDDDTSNCSLDGSSDGDSFCDADIQEKADQEYIRKDLGASCFFQADDTNFLDNKKKNPASKNKMPEMIMEDEED